MNFNDTNGNMYSHTYLYEYYDINSWSDTLLHMGLSPDQSTFLDFARALALGIGKQYAHTAQAIKNRYFNNLLSETILETNIVSATISLLSHFSLLIAPIIPSNFQGYDNFINNYTIETSQNVCENSNSLGLGNIIYSQYDPLISKFRYGMVDDSDAGWCFNATECTCEPIAIYNALVLMGKRPLFSEIILMCELSGELILDGFFGATPEVTEYVARKYNLKLRSTTDLDVLDSWIAPNKVMILTYWNRKWNVLRGAHSVAAVKHKDKDNLDIYNCFSNAENDVSYVDSRWNNFNSFINNPDFTKSLIRAYCFE